MSQFSEAYRSDAAEIVQPRGGQVALPPFEGHQPCEQICPACRASRFLDRFEIVEQVSKICLQYFAIGPAVRIDMPQPDLRKVRHWRRRVVFLKAPHDEAANELAGEIAVIALLEANKIRRRHTEVIRRRSRTSALRAMACGTFLSVNFLPVLKRIGSGDGVFGASGQEQETERSDVGGAFFHLGRIPLSVAKRC